MTTQRSLVATDTETLTAAQLDIISRRYAKQRELANHPELKDGFYTNVVFSPNTLRIAQRYTRAFVVTSVRRTQFTVVVLHEVTPTEFRAHVQPYAGENVPIAMIEMTLTRCADGSIKFTAGW